MKSLILILVTAITCSGLAQADIPLDWNISLNESGKIGIYHPLKDKEYRGNFIVDYKDEKYIARLDVHAGEWGFVQFPEDFDFTYENIPDGSGIIKADLVIQVDNETIYDKTVFLTARNSNQPYETNIKEIENHINLYGSVIDDCIFWKDNAGYNYVIRSHHNGKSGIFMSHWVMDVSGNTERINYYKNQEDCMSDRVQNQSHSIGWKLEDANEDGYMEFYSLIFDACEESRNHPQYAMLVIYTNFSDLYLTGHSYSLLEETDDFGGDFKPSEKLTKHPKIEVSAEEAWDVYIME